MKRRRDTLGAALAVVAAIGCVSCNKDPYGNLGAPRDFFSKEQVGSSADFAIIKFGNPDDHVVTVHGFSDDAGSCREIADALNTNACRETAGRDCLSPYSCKALN